MEKQTEFGKKWSELVDKSFTEKFKKGEIILDVLLDKLEVKVERVDIYDNGGIMGIALDLNEHNKSILSEIIKDFDSYNELVDLEINSDMKEGQTDLFSLLDYSQGPLREEIRFDWDNKIFYYLNGED